MKAIFKAGFLHSSGEVRGVTGERFAIGKTPRRDFSIGASLGSTNLAIAGKTGFKLLTHPPPGVLNGHNGTRVASPTEIKLSEVFSRVPLPFSGRFRHSVMTIVAETREILIPYVRTRIFLSLVCL